MQNYRNKNKKTPSSKKKGQTNRSALVIVMVFTVAILSAVMMNTKQQVNEIPYSEFLTNLKENKVKTARIINHTTIEGELKPTDKGTRYRTSIPYADFQLVDRLAAAGVRIESGVSYNVGGILISFLPWVVVLFIFWRMFANFQKSASGGNSPFSFGESRARRYDHNDEKKRITFADVAGQKEPKEELQEVVAFLKNPTRFEEIGAKIPKGVLLVGNPGTGKTLLGRAVAGEAQVPFFSISGSDFIEMFAGVGASRVRDLFRKAREAAPCIIFIDEIDAVGRARGSGVGGTHDEREQTLNQMLVEMDGFDGVTGVIVLAATNRPDVLDPALLRPGRFDRQVTIDLPDVKEREEILKIHAKKIKMMSAVNLSRIARSTVGASGADLANIVNESALLAARNDRKEVSDHDLDEAVDKSFMGVARRSRVMSKEELKLTAYHEAGHALLHYYLDHADPIRKVTIVPRGRALGVTFSLPEKDNYSHTKLWFIDRLVIIFGGYAAEQIIFDTVTSGAQGDIQQATAIVRRMVCEWGMGDTVGQLAWGNDSAPMFLGRELATGHHSYSNETASKIDADMNALVSGSLARARQLLTDHKDQLDALAQGLLDQETLNDDEIRTLLGMPNRQPEEILA
jgi:cell division protease FtsH